jgi:helicase
MISKWLRQQMRYPAVYKFPVHKITELNKPSDELLDNLALALLLAHGNPYQITDQYKLLLEDAEDNSLSLLKKYLEDQVFPDKKKMHGIARIGNFGEVLASLLLVEFENFWFPIYKLRFREKKDWAMRLTDLCLIKRSEGVKPLICYGEVKTISGECDQDIAIKGHNSLVLGEAKDLLSNPEVLHFISTILYETHRYEEASFISRIQLGKIEYDKRHDLFIVHSSERWTDEILNRLENHPLDNRLVDFSLKVVLVAQLKKLIDDVYERSTVVTQALINTMNQQEYLNNIYVNLASLTKDGRFQRELAQVQARSIQEELSSTQFIPQYTFNSEEVWHKCNYIFSNSSLLLREEIGGQENLEKRQIALDSLRTVAQSFEFLSKFAKEEEQEIFLINSAICYHMAGYHANAQCIAKLLQQKYHAEDTSRKQSLNHESNLTWFFRQSLVSFLRRDITSLQKTTEQAIAFVQTLQEALTSNSEEDVFLNISDLYGHLFFQKALLNFTQYCIYGTQEQFSLAQRNMQKCSAYFQNTGDTRLDVLASELRTLLKLFDERSTWSNITAYGENRIESPIWRTYLKNLALEKSIVEFWRSQLKALESGLLTTEDSFIIQMPTSAGKTFVAELAILATLTNPQQKRCLYIAPYRALVNEIEDKLSETLGALGYRVSNLTGGFEFDSLQNFLAVQSDVLVTTPEKADLLFRTHPEYFQDIATIVIDEGHMLDEGIPSQQEIDKDKALGEVIAENGTLGRGIALEILISRLKQKLPEACFLFLSAVMPEVNVDDFVNWLSKESQKPLKIDRNDRPSRQTIASFSWLAVRPKDHIYDGRLQYFNRDGTKTFVPYFLQQEKYYTGDLTPTGKRQTVLWPKTTNKAQSTGMLASQFAKTGPVLVFCAMPSQVKVVVENIIKSLTYLEASDRLPADTLKYRRNPELESFDLAKEWLGDDHPLTKGLHYGVGLHYGPLPDPVRQAVEDDFREGKISLLVCTNTLGQGVNMPVKTAIIYSLERTYPDPNEVQKRKTAKVKKRDFWNICGRAGRAGKETEGQIVFVTNSRNDDTLFREYQDEQNIEVVESPLYKLLKALVEKRISQDELIDYLDPYVLALLAEEVVDTKDETAIKNFLEASLVGVQALRNNLDLTPLASTLDQTAIRIYQEVPDQAQRVVFASTGLQVKSCITLENMAEAFLQVYDRNLLEDKLQSLILNESLLEYAFKACREIPEMKLARGIKAREPADELKLVKDWVGGTSIHEIRSTYWARDQEDEFGEYIADRIIYKLPWGFNGFLRILAFKLGLSYEALPLNWQFLPSMMKLGVNSIFACWISSLGVSSRQLAFELARRYPNTDDNSYASFLRWAINLPIEFLFQEVPVGSVAEKKRFVRKLNKIVSDDSHLQFILQKQTKLESSIQGIPYQNRAEVASRIQVGNQLELQAEPDNEYDPSAVSILFNGKQVGYVEREKARIISKEIQLGRNFQVYAKAVKPPMLNYAYPHIVVSITG